jgi:hypothetical protein
VTNVARMDATSMDTIAGSKLLLERFQSAAAFQPDQAVMHKERRATFVHMRDGAGVIRYWGDGRAVAVPPEHLSRPPANGRRWPAPY